MSEIPCVNYSSPHVFTFKQRVSLTLLSPLIAWTLKALFATCKVEVRRADYRQQLLDQRQGHVIAIWHETMHLAAQLFRNTGHHTLTSYSFDGELAARVVRRFGLFAVRGSSSRGGSDALHDLELALKHTTVGFTLDGPKGPRRVAKPGIAILAARAQAPILPLAIAVNRCWRLHSWDRLPIPKPFAKITIEFGPPIPPPHDFTDETIEETRLRAEQGLNAVHQKIEGHVLWQE